MTKFYNNLSKIFFFIFFLFLFLLTPSKQVFAEPFVGDKLEKFLFENTITYERGGYQIKISFYDNKTYLFEVYVGPGRSQSHRGDWSFVNSKKAVYLPQSITDRNQYLLGAEVPIGFIEFDNKFIHFKERDNSKGGDKIEYNSFNRLIEQQRQAEIRRQEEIKKEQDRIKAEQLKKEVEAKAAIVKKQAEERAAIAKREATIAKKEAEEQQARLEKEQQEKDRREAILNGIRLIAILSVITGLSFYLYKFKKNKIKQLFSKLNQLFLKLWNARWGGNNWPIGRYVSIFLIIIIVAYSYEKLSYLTSKELNPRDRMNVRNAAACLGAIKYYEVDMGVEVTKRSRAMIAPARANATVVLKVYEDYRDVHLLKQEGEDIGYELNNAQRIVLIIECGKKITE